MGLEAFFPSLFTFNKSQRYRKHHQPQAPHKCVHFPGVLMRLENYNCPLPLTAPCLSLLLRFPRTGNFLRRKGSSLASILPGSLCRAPLLLLKGLFSATVCHHCRLPGPLRSSPNLPAVVSHRSGICSLLSSQCPATLTPSYRDALAGSYFWSQLSFSPMTPSSSLSFPSATALGRDKIVSFPPLGSSVL
jgi:hypothetical protein